MPPPDDTPASPVAVVLIDRPFDATSLRTLRYEVERRTGANGLGELALHRFLVAVNEITTNAVQHGGGAGRLELWRLGDRLYCRVTDRGAGIPPGSLARTVGPPPPNALNGRGLWLARTWSATMDVMSGKAGTVITLAGEIKA